MNLTPSPKGRRMSGLTLLEMTVVIAVLLSLITSLFIGANAWKRGSDRSTCLLNQRNIQLAVRSYQNLYGYNYGGRPYAEAGTQDIGTHLHQKGYIGDKLAELDLGTTTCPGGGTYSRLTPDMFPLNGQLYVTCSLSAAQNHQPQNHADW
jgi:type II secretory pathway pseudopilin PulG